LKAGDPEAFAALSAADKRVWQAGIVKRERTAGLTSAKIEERLARIALEGWTFEVYSDDRFCALMEVFIPQVCQPCK
jgi:hypothetical protein